jgi:hypothetical protein
LPRRVEVQGAHVLIVFRMLAGALLDSQLNTGFPFASRIANPLASRSMCVAVSRTVDAVRWMWWLSGSHWPRHRSEILAISSHKPVYWD